MGGDGTVGLGMKACSRDGSVMAACRRSIRFLREPATDLFVRWGFLPIPCKRSRLSISRKRSSPRRRVRNGSSFAHTVTGGTLPEGIRQVSSDFKTRFGLSAYVVSELLRVGNDRRYRLRIVADGEETVEDIGSFVAFSANALANEFTSSAPTRLDDGLLHLIALKSASLPALFSLAPYALARTLEKSREVLYCMRNRSK